ncbi:DegV family protein [Caproiciproducens sp. MSJ-32]|uniref:DegV family protein n=1 Tax=Caproiciproducens sp. MSJ-32 TaxID=2841527 RepID=UPI001C100482|nr:DegV family protein [Caproiciproducens sp. MSJ-32]MBU5454862.1 DegV family protein [Caproiciproducens sp. MSJ-32]
MIKILSDSSTLYSIKEEQANNIDIAPLQVTINNKTYTEFEDIDSKQVIDLINEGHVPKSSQPSIGKVLELYQRYPEEKGYTKERIIKDIKELIESSKSFLIPNDFDFLVRGGRLSPIVGKIGSAIKLVPVLSLSKDGTTLEKFATTRSFKKAMAKICDYLHELKVDDSYKIYITHGFSENLAKEAKEILLNKIKNADIVTRILSPAFITQGGPGCVAIQVIKRHVID